MIPHKSIFHTSISVIVTSSKLLAERINDLAMRFLASASHVGELGSVERIAGYDAERPSDTDSPLITLLGCRGKDVHWQLIGWRALREWLNRLGSPNLILLLYCIFPIIGFMLGDWLGLIVGTLFGITGIGVSIYLARRVEGFLQDMRRSQIDEKIAVTFRTASEVKTWERQGIDVDLSIRKVIADLKAVERVKKAMAADQHNELIEAMRTLVNALKANKYDIAAGRLEDAAKLLD